jgi:hypothetical protein
MSFYVVVLHDAAEGTMRDCARSTGKGHEIESAADVLANYRQIASGLQAARMSAQSLLYQPMNS